MTFCQRGKDKVNKQNLSFRPSSKLLKVEVLINYSKCSSVLFILELLPDSLLWTAASEEVYLVPWAVLTALL